MAESIRFHLDENANNAIADGLRRRGIDVTISVQANLISASDEQQLAYAHAQGRVLFTQDRDFWSCIILNLSIQELCMRSKEVGQLARF